MKIKNLAINFLGGIVGTLMLATAGSVFLTIYLDKGNVNNFTIGKGKLLAYTFYKSSNEFKMSLGPGLGLIALLGGIIVLIITLLIYRFIKVKHYD